MALGHLALLDVGGLAHVGGDGHGGTELGGLVAKESILVLGGVGGNDDNEALGVVSLVDTETTIATGNGLVGGCQVSGDGIVTLGDGSAVLGDAKGVVDSSSGGSVSSEVGESP